MPGTGLRFKDKIYPITATFVNGLPTQNEGTLKNSIPSAAQFIAGTGNASNTVSGIADVTPTGGTVTLIPDVAVPAGMRCYITRLDIDMQGATAWSGGTYITVQDSAGHPIVYIPKLALSWPLAEFSLPSPNLEVPIVATAASFAAATGVITLPASTLAAGTGLNNAPFTVVSGTGQGQSGIISSYTTTSITPVGGSTAFPVALDNTSVIAVWYWQATGGSTTTAAFSNAAFTGNTLDNGFNLLAITSVASQGSVRQIISNTSTTPTIATGTPFQGAGIASGDVLQITNNSELMGIVDMGIADKWASLQVGKGVQVALTGAWSTGSPLRVYIEGFFA